MEIHEIIRQLREDADLTQSQVAEKLGTTRQYYNKYENGLHPISTEVLRRLYFGFAEESNVAGMNPRKEAAHAPVSMEPLARLPQMQSRLPQLLCVLLRRQAAEGRERGYPVQNEF